MLYMWYINFTPKDYQLSVKVGKHLSYTPDNLDSWDICQWITCSVYKQLEKQIVPTSSVYFDLQVVSPYPS